MPKLAQQLSDLAAKKARPKDAAYSLASGNGVHLVIQPTGQKQWQVRYRTPDNQRGKKIVGTYPGMSIADAHKAAEELHLSVRAGNKAEGMRDRIKAAKETRTQEEIEAELAAKDARAHSFTVLSDAWLKARRPGWAPATYDKAQYIITKYLQPAIGDADMRTMASKDVVETLRTMGASVPSLARKARQYLNGVIEYCIQSGIRQDDQVLRLGRVLPKAEGGHIPAITKVQGIGPLMRAIQDYQGVIVRAGLLLAAYTACRPGVVAAAQWQEIDLDRAEWCIPAAKMKMRHEHIVSLPAQAVVLLQDIRQYGDGEYVFPGSQSNRHMHRDALSKALREMGFQGRHATHGFRAMLRTVARERLKIDVDVLEAQLSHAKKDEIQAAYDRARFEDERRQVMQVWADFLHEQAGQKTIIEMRRA
ncbi:MAG: tyrosine-type recombinase/integrase [Castellaniella sp.]|nr:tyrosine-type recombinase/integrase [Castellaniella sp.]